ncbi:MAG: ABC transporter ATP-binding protein [Oleiphilaceae bacterium]|nr:ABC transporter ATP-binding protein [Oleiphilaceae bacterium]
MIRAEQLEVIFNAGTPLENRALRGVSIDIPKGQFVTVIGSNGAGKSTLLNALAGEVSCQQGHILLDDEDITAWPVHRRAPLIARVFQDPLMGTCENLTIEENLALAMSRTQRRGLGKAAKQAYRERFRERLATLQLGLENRLTDKIGLLSGGQRQAVSLLMAALQPMKLLLLDEHTAALDPKTAQFILELTQSIVAEQNLTALMVTHSMKQALAVGDRTIMLHQGRIALDVAGDDRKGLGTQDLLDLFHKNHEAVEDDALLLG